MDLAATILGTLAAMQIAVILHAVADALNHREGHNFSPRVSYAMLIGMPAATLAFCIATVWS